MQKNRCYFTVFLLSIFLFSIFLLNHNYKQAIIILRLSVKDVLFLYIVKLILFFLSK